MNVLVLGSGGREHALCDALTRSSHIDQLYCAPGNPGIHAIATCVSIDINQLDAITDFVQEKNIQLIIPGSEQSLSTGIADYYLNRDVCVFGPTIRALQIESSKSFAKQLMNTYAIPTAQHVVFSDFNEAKAYVLTQQPPIVIKYDGLAAGKGVRIASSIDEAIVVLEDMLLKRVFGNAPVIIEEFLEGIEFSLICFVHGETLIQMPIAQDHKRIYENNQGPMTGGMGAYSPVSIISEATIEEAMQSIMIPTAKALVKENASFTGFLYGGLIATSKGPKVIEFNARLGDPEAEVILPRLESDIIDIIYQLINDSKPTINWNPNTVLGVVLAAPGYPGPYEKQVSLSPLLLKETVYHMGTTVHNDSIVSSGGRVLCVIGEGTSLQEAKNNAYMKIMMYPSGLYYRCDIGDQSLKGKHNG